MRKKGSHWHLKGSIYNEESEQGSLRNRLLLVKHCVNINGYYDLVSRERILSYGLIKGN